MRLMAIVVLLIGTFVANFMYTGYYELNKPLVLEAEGISFKLKPGTHVRGFLENLNTDPELAPFSSLFAKLYVRYYKIDKKLQAGEYRFGYQSSLKDIIQQCVAGDVVLYAFTVVEGKTFETLLQELQTHPQIKPTLKDKSISEVALALGLVTSPEGLFLPETYFFPKGTTDLEFLKRANMHLKKNIDALWRHRQPDVAVKSPYEAIILASIVEKETGQPQERPLISAVFNHRLHANMRLQADPTVIYGLGKDFNGDITKKDLKTDTKFNTYMHKGLPPTPIALPSYESIKATLNPADVNYLYFVAKGDGSHYFSHDLKEHQQAVEKYIRKSKNVN